MQDQTASYVVHVRNVEVECATPERVLELVQTLTREVAREEPRGPLAEHIMGLLRDGRARTPTEIVHALQDMGFAPSKATYNRVYAALRYGDFEKRPEGWVVAA